VTLDQRISKKPMKKNRGTGLVYQPTYVDKGTGERKAAFHLVDSVLCPGQAIPRVLRFPQSNGS